MRQIDERTMQPIIEFARVTAERVSPRVLGDILKRVGERLDHDVHSDDWTNLLHAIRMISQLHIRERKGARMRAARTH